MTLREATSERMVFGVMGLLVAAGLSVLVLSGYASAKGVPDTIQGTILGSVWTLIGVAFQAVFRTDRVDEERARTAAVATGAMASAIPSAPPAAPTPVTVENSASDPANVAVQPATQEGSQP